MVVEKVRETQAGGDIPPVKGGLVGGGGESSASPSIVLFVAFRDAFSYLRASSRARSSPRACLPAVNPVERRGKTPLPSLSRPPSSESLNSIPYRCMEMETLGHYRPTVDDTLLRGRRRIMS